MALGPNQVRGQDYPNKPIRIIGGSPGGGNDITARLIGQAISATLGQPVIVENVAGGAIGSAEATLRAAPDGYTMVVIGGAIWITPILQKTPSYDAVTDFAPITLISRGPAIVAVHPSLPAKSVKELVALARSRPGELNFASSVIGGSVQLATGLFKSMAGIKVIEVPYRGNVQQIMATVAGEVQVAIVDVGLVVPHMKVGRLRGLAVTSATPTSLAPELPTVSGAGIAGYEYVGATGLLAPAKTPAAIISRLNREAVRVLVSPAVKEQYLGRGEEVVASSPEQFAAMIKAESAKWTKVIKEASIVVQ
jgi:tripartite-type tricarboxylate transporter receptor subunit TctC